jgi:vacuolar-type H+-ATPase subunit F/Vma7
MPAAITITDESTLTIGQEDRSFTLVLPHDIITVRELIVQRVRAEVDAYNREKPQYFPGLVRPIGSEHTRSGYRHAAFRPLAWRAQAEEALHAFQSNGFIILVNDQRVESFEDRIALTPETKITFFRRVQLMGG